MTKPKTPPQATPEQELNIVKHLAHGRGLDFTATATGLTPDQVRHIGAEHGWPDDAALARAADLLTQRLDEQARATITERPDLEVVRQNHRPSGQSRRETSRPKTSSTPRLVDATEDLLLRGRKSSRKRTVALADKAEQLLTDLRQRLDAEDKADREKREAQRRREEEKAQRYAEREEARAEVERLQQQLAEAKARARGAKDTGPQAEAATIRAWAHDNGVDCPRIGRVPKRVVEAYEKARRRAS